MKLIPVDGDPFSDEPKKGYKLRLVEGNPFEEPVPMADDPGAFGAGVIGFGRMSDRILKGVKQGALTVASPFSPGARGELSRMSEEEARNTAQYAKLEKQHPYATMAGEALPMLAMPMGGSFKAAAAIGAIPGLLEYGTPQEKLVRGGAGAAGGGLGYGAGKAIGAAISPAMKAANPEIERLVEIAAKEGIPLDAAQVTGNPVLQGAKGALGKIPWTAGGQQARAQTQQEAYNAALLRYAGSNAKAATPDVLGDVSATLGGNIEKASSNVVLAIDDSFVNGLAEVERKFLRRLPTDQKPVIQSYLDDLTELITKGGMPGDVYQSTRSELGQLAAETNNNTVKHSAKQMQKVLDDWFDRQASPEAVSLMHDARKKYAKAETITNAVKKGRSQDGNVSAKQAYAQAQQDIPGFAKGRGGEFADLVRAGRQFLPDPIPNSGTPERLMYQNLLSAGSMSGLGALGGFMANGDPSAGAMAGLAGFGLSKAAQKALNSPQLTKYLMSQTLTEEQKRLLARGGGLLGLAGASSSQ